MAGHKIMMPVLVCHVCHLVYYKGLRKVKGESTEMTSSDLLKAFNDTIERHNESQVARNSTAIA